MFKRAVAVFPRYGEGKESYNRSFLFREKIDKADGALIRISASDLYRIYANGRFLGYGPARAAKGYARVDEYTLPEDITGECEIVIEVASYGCTAFYTPKSRGFLTAEIERGGEVLKYTGRDFSAYENAARVRRVERLSVQRHFAEVYDLVGYERFDERHTVKAYPVSEEPIYIPRRAPYPCYTPVSDFASYNAKGVFSEGDINSIPRPVYFDYGAAWDFFEDEEIERPNHRYVKAMTFTRTSDSGELPVTLRAGEWCVAQLPVIAVGFLRISVSSKKESDIIVAFTENPKGEFELGKFNMQTTVEYKLPCGGVYDFETFEVYGFKKIAVIATSGEVTLGSVGYRPYERDTSGIIERSFRHEKLGRIYDAAVRSFAHNSVDIYMDCPTRERAGWLCDSYFSARAEDFLFGDSVIEDVFLENYLLYKNDGVVPRGILPMCYPADYGKDGGYIPQWTMWYVIEVCEYLTRRRPDADREPFRKTVTEAVEYFISLENSDGLLEGLPGWNFIEWSDANKWCRDVNYPTNFLYAEMLSSAARLYGDVELEKRADRIRKKCERLSFNGEVFVDNAVRDAQGVLKNTANVSEAGQYYAILFGRIDVSLPKYGKLLEYIGSGFSGYEEERGALCRINAFIGLYLRVMLLVKLGLTEALYRTVTEHCLPMAEATGTLWEMKLDTGSLDHGFASYLATALPMADEYEGDL